MALHVRQAEVAARMPERQLFVVETQQPENGRVQVVDVYFALDRLKAKFVGRAVDVPPSDTAAAQPHGEAVMIVIPAIDFPRV